MASSRPMPAAPSIPAEGQKAANALSSAFVAVAEFVKPSVVQISVERKRADRSHARRQSPDAVPGTRRQPRPQGLRGDAQAVLRPRFPSRERAVRPTPGSGTGSGFVFDDQGHILTNNHVVEGAEKITVTFNDGDEASAKVVGTDPAVGRGRHQGRQHPLSARCRRGSSSKLKVGELVMAVGSPFGLSQTVTTGIISATERNDVHINEYESFLQTDAAINPGNSGGPLVDMDGRVVGINSAIVTGSRGNDGVGFAIPIDLAAQLADKLIKDGKVQRAGIGIGLDPLTPALAKQLRSRSPDQGRDRRRWSSRAARPTRRG